MSVAAITAPVPTKFCLATTTRGCGCLNRQYLDFTTCKRHTKIEKQFCPETREEWLRFKETHCTSVGKPLALELFKGTGSIDKAIHRSTDMDVVSFDLEKFYRPDICADFMEFDFFNIFEPGEFDYVWASPVCTSWSICTHKHRYPLCEDPDMTPQTATGRLGNAMIMRLTEVIDYLEPKCWMIENPRGRLRHWKPFKKWVESQCGSRLTVYYGNHNHYLKKATDIWNNSPNGLLNYTEKTPTGTFKTIDELTLEQRYAMPPDLCDMLVKFARVQLDVL